MISFPSTMNQGGMYSPLYNEEGRRISPNESHIDSFLYDVSRIKSLNTNLNATFKHSLMEDSVLDISNNMYRIKHRPILGQNATMFKGEGDGSTNTTDTVGAVAAENPYRIPASILTTLNRYNTVYKTPVTNLIAAGKSDVESANTEGNGTSYNIEYVGLKTKVVSSTFSPIHFMKVVGFSDNLPLLNSYMGETSELIDLGPTSQDLMNKTVTRPKQFTSALAVPAGYTFDPATSTAYDASGQKYMETVPSMMDTFKDNNVTFKKDVDNVEHMYATIQYNPFDKKMVDNTGDCSIRELVRLSHTPNGQLGMAKYKYADFLFCKHIGKVTNSHLITLRRFAHPVDDNIFRYAGKGYMNNIMPGYHGFQENASIGTMITWFGTDDNKLEDILGYSFFSSFKKVDAEIQEKNSQEDEQSGGVIGMFANSFNKTYNAAAARGMAGSNGLWSKLGSKMFGGMMQGVSEMSSAFIQSGANGEVHASASTLWEMQMSQYDKHKIYTPQNTVQSTHLYEGKLEFTHEFTLKFSYRLRALDIMNPKSTMLDLLGNILEVTYNRGRFWGGEQRLVGPPRNLSTFATANAFIDRQWEKLEGFVQGFANGNLDWSGILSSLSDMVSGVVNEIKSTVERNGGVLNTLVNGAKSMAGKFVSSGASRAFLGQLKNQLGRPAMYAFNSLLSGDPVGLWHVTIGNPKNPIAAFGNLILKDTKITHSGPLGFDDFPTEIQVACTLHHARPRELTEIARMYTKGTGAFYQTIDKNKLSEFFKVSNTAKGKDVESEMAAAAQYRSAAEQLVSADAQIAQLKKQSDDIDKKMRELTNKQQEEAKKKAEEEKAQNANNQTPQSANTSDDSKTSKKPVSQPATQPSNTQSTQSAEDTNKQLEELGKQKGEIDAKIKNLEKLQRNINDIRNNENQSKQMEKYLSPNYSVIYGSTEDFKESMKKPTQLYEDNVTKNNDWYRFGHYITDSWALRYETLGQDLDTEARLLIDENA